MQLHSPVAVAALLFSVRLIASDERLMTQHGLPARVIACHDCGQAYPVSTLPDDAVAHCHRCNSVLWRPAPDYQVLVSLTVALLILVVIMLTQPVLSLRIGAETVTGGLLTAVSKLYDNGMPEIAVIVALTAIVVPLLQIVLVLAVSLPMMRGTAPAYAAPLLRILAVIEPWGMMDVMLIGVFVAAVKLFQMAALTIDPGLWAEMFAVLLLASVISRFQRQHIWSLLSQVTGDTAADANAAEWVVCHHCKLPSLLNTDHEQPCDHCHAPLHRIKPYSLQRTWAYLIAAIICLFPANLYPVMKTVTFAGTQGDTIMSGVIYFLEHGDWPLALIIFFASVMIPLSKIFAIVYLLISVHFRSASACRERTQIYRLAELAGRWSMIDIFVVAMMITLVSFDPLVSIKPDTGAVFFAAVVLLTMMAALSFDPKLIWEPEEKLHGG